jgi:hypothetical protein
VIFTDNSPGNAGLLTGAAWIRLTAESYAAARKLLAQVEGEAVDTTPPVIPPGRPAAKTPPAPQSPQRNRRDRLTRAILAALEASPDMTANEAFDWLKKNDATQAIVDSADFKLVWEDTRGELHEIDRAAFANRISRLRKTVEKAKNHRY